MELAGKVAVVTGGASGIGRALCRRFSADGATVVLQSLHRTVPAVGRFASALEAEISHPVQVNAYLTPPGAQPGLRLADRASISIGPRCAARPATVPVPWSAEAVAEDEAALEDRSQTVMEIPTELVPAVRELIARHGR